MDSAAMQQVLESPELLTRICEIIHKDEALALVKSSLPSAARVNSRWRDIVLRIWWAEPSAEALARVRRSRRQMYASQIKTLNFDFARDSTLNTLFGGLQFHRLQSLVLAGHPVGHSRHGPLGNHGAWNSTVSQYLGPALEELALHSCDAVCTPNFLTDVAARCLRLKRVKFVRVGAQLQADNLLKFFEACNLLEDVRLGLGDDMTNFLVTGDLLLCLSRMRKLRHLEIDQYLGSWESFKTIKDQNVAPFQSLTSISLNASSKVFSAATRVLPNVEEFTVRLHTGGDGSCFEDLATMPRLRKLIIFGTVQASFTRRDLLELRALKDLEELDISLNSSNPQDNSHTQYFGDSDFDHFISGFPKLRNFAFDIISEVHSMAVLSSLSKHCPKLETLALNGSYDLQALNELTTISFPRLREFKVDYGDVEGVAMRLQPLQIARLIDNCAPMLDLLTFTADTEGAPPIGLMWVEFNA